MENTSDSLFVCLFSTLNESFRFVSKETHTHTPFLPVDSQTPNFDSSKGDKPSGLLPRCSQATQTLPQQMLWKLMSGQDLQIYFCSDRSCRHWDCCEEALTGEIGETSEMEPEHTLRYNVPGNPGENILVPPCAMKKHSYLVSDLAIMVIYKILLQWVVIVDPWNSVTRLYDFLESQKGDIAVASSHSHPLSFRALLVTKWVRVVLWSWAGPLQEQV